MGIGYEEFLIRGLGTADSSYNFTSSPKEN